MGKGLNLNNKHFYYLTAINKVGISKSGNILWRCLCACGKVTIVSSNNLISGHTKSCGCYRRQKSAKSSKQLKGRYFGRLLVIHRVGSNLRRRCCWKCRCICGKECIVPSDSLLSGNTQSCGCLRVDNMRKIRTDTSMTAKQHYISKSGKLFLDLLEQEFQLKIRREIYKGGKYFDGGIGRILIEIDSDYWHRSKKAKKVDALKDEIALRNGYAIVRVVVNKQKEVRKLIQYYKSSFEKILKLQGIL